MEIKISKNVFYFADIKQIVEKLGVEPTNYHEGLIFRMLDPLNENYRHYKQESHLTDQQSEMDQIRYLGAIEIERKIIRLAYMVNRSCGVIKIHLQFPINLQPSEHLVSFISYLKMFNINSEITITYCNKIDNYKEIDKSELSGNIFTINKDEKSVLTTYNKCVSIMNAGDYYTAINILKKLSELNINNQSLIVDIESKLALCYGILGQTFNAEKFWLYVVENGNFEQKNRAFYALGVLYIRHHPKKYQNIEIGKKYLSDIYGELLKTHPQDNENRGTVNQVFNRNAYALALFKEGQIEEAEKLVSEGVLALNDVDSFYSFFHKTVLIYNVAQCQIINKEFDKAEATLMELMNMDYKFYVYHEYLIEFYLKSEQYEKMEIACNNAIKMDNDHYKFHQLLALKHFECGEYNDSMKNFRVSLSLNPADLISISYLTPLLLQNGDFQDCVSIMSKIDFQILSDESFNMLSSIYILSLLNLKIDAESTLSYLLKVKPENQNLLELKKHIADGTDVV